MSGFLEALWPEGIEVQASPPAVTPQPPPQQRISESSSLADVLGLFSSEPPPAPHANPGGEQDPSFIPPDADTDTFMARAAFAPVSSPERVVLGIGLLDEEQVPGEPIQSEIATFFPLALAALVRNDGAATVFESPPAEPSDLRPVTNTETSFGPVQEHGPISNDRAAVVHHGPAGFIPQQIQPNQDVKFFPYPVPITNDRAAIIHQAPDPFAVSPYQPGAISSSDVRFSPAPPPIANDPTRTIMRHDAPPSAPEIPPNLHYLPQHLSPGSLDVRFIPSPQPISNDANVAILGGVPAQNLPSPFQPGVIHVGQGDVQIMASEAPPASPGVVNVGGGTVQILPGRHAPPVPLAGDVFFGGGGDNTRQVRSDEVTFGGFSMPDQGNSDIFMAPSGDMTKQAGTGDVLFGGKGGVHSGGADVQFAPSGDITKVPNQDDVIMTLNAGAIGNQEAITGATGDPTANRDHVETTLGARGRPKNVKG